MRTSTLVHMLFNMLRQPNLTHKWKDKTQAKNILHHNEFRMTYILLKNQGLIL